MSGELSSQIHELRLLLGSSRDPEGRAFAQLGDALRRAGETEEALAVLRDGIARHPDFTPGHLVLAWTLQEQGDAESALAAFGTALELDPENPYALFGTGSLRASRGDEEGVRMVEAALALDPGVRTAAPSLPVAGREPARPFVALAELAPEAVEHERPFMALAELVPEAAEQQRPFVALAELAPEAEEHERPFVALAELAPEAVEPERPFVALTELEPEVAEPEGAPEETELGGDATAGDGDEPRDESDEGDASPVTRTMAELFASQGYPDRAIRIYERLLLAAPGEAALLDRLAELRAAAGDGEAAGATHGAGAHAAAVEGDADLHPALDVPAPLPLTPSPYGWDGDTESPAAHPPAASAGAYFGRLLAWTPGNPAREADEASNPDPGNAPTQGEER